MSNNYSEEELSQLPFRDESLELEERINQFTENGSCRIVLNLKGIHFIDSKGFATLVRVAKMAEEKKYSFHYYKSFIYLP